MQSQGSISVYIVLLIMLMVTSSAIVLSGIISQQIRISENIVSSERAFYAAGSGVEDALYQLVQLSQDVSEGEVAIEDGEIEYEDETSTYQVSAALFLSENTQSSRPCVNSKGSYHGEDRRINLQSPGDAC